MTDVVTPPSDNAPNPPPSRRRINRGLLWASGLAVIVLVIATLVAFTADPDDDVMRIDPNAPTELQGRDVTGETVPDDALERFDGGELTGSSGSLRGYVGRPLVVNFFASWCTPCITEMPAFEQVHRSNPNVTFLGINSLEQPESGSRIIKQTGVTYDILRDGNGALAQELGVLNMPATLFVGTDGTIVRVHIGQLSQGELEQIIRDDLHA
jgi:thiol-disulfide isomerase/thioredoxin